MGFLPLKVHTPSAQEAKQNHWGDKVQLVIDEWLLLEYACVTLPANQDALVEAVAKGSVALPVEVQKTLGLSGSTATLSFTPLVEVERAVRRHFGVLNLDALVQQAVHQALDRARGRV